jgi:hypothetical protein
VSDVRSSGSTTTSGSGYSDIESYSTIEIRNGDSDLLPVPFQELSSVQYFSLDEQLTQLTAALKNQFQRHCFIQIRQQETQPMLVPFVEPAMTFTHSRKNLDWYIEKQHEKQKELPAAEVDRLLKEQETALLQTIEAKPVPDEPAEGEPAPALPPPPEKDHRIRKPIWDRSGTRRLRHVRQGKL